VITLIDTDKYNQRDLIDQQIALGLGYLFSEQVVGFSTEYRKMCYTKLAQAIRRAVENPIASNVSLEPAHARTKTAGNHNYNNKTSITSQSMDQVLFQFRKRVVKKYGSAELAWEDLNSLSDNEGLSRTDFKTAVSMLGLTASRSDKRSLRKALDPENIKVIQYKDFKAFIEMGSSAESNEHSPGLALAVLPIDVPSLPESYRHRESNENQIIALLTGRISSKSSCIAAQGSYFSPK
jgi:hypothetical protein